MNGLTYPPADFAAYDYTDAESRTRMLRQIGSWVGQAPNAAGPPEPSQNTKPFVTVLRHVEGLAQTAVLELGYVDKDYQSEYEQFYASCFRSLDRLCCRIHFFSEKFSDNDLSQLRKLYEADRPRDALPFYLGFCVLRPLPGRRVSRTVLSAAIVDRLGWRTTGVEEYHANIMGVTLTVRGAPFTQQETQVGACAQAALWMASRYCHKHFRHTRFTTAEITTLANQYYQIGRIFPAEHGLTASQITSALIEMGYSPLTWDPRFHSRYSDPGQMIPISRWSFVFRFVASGIPVILALSLKGIHHAVVAFGHLEAHAAPVAVDPDIGYRSSSSWYGGLLINNDNEGPYMHLLKHVPEGELRVGDFVSKYNFTELSERNPRDESAVVIQSIIVPLPREVRLNGDYVEWLAFKFFDGEAMRRETAELDWHGYYLHTFLAESNSLKACWCDRAACGNQWERSVAEFYLHLGMPKYVWITEIRPVDAVPGHPRHGRCIGEAVFDTTGSPHWDNFLVGHLRGVLVSAAGEPAVAEGVPDSVETYQSWLDRRK